jgi:heme/copper-type cytochrome/quinol oxidase subunit 2
MNLKLIAGLLAGYALLSGGCCGRPTSEAAPARTDLTYAAIPGPTNFSGNVIDGVRDIKMTAEKFDFKPATIYVKKGEPVRLEITSLDTTHGIAIEGTDINQTLTPNKTEVIEFTPQRTGTFEYYCTQYCGTGHTKMRGKMIVREGAGT